jgi:HK97 family phage major capsid protein
MITLEEFLKRFPGRVDQTTKDELQLFMDAVTDMSDDYETMLLRLRATGKFKSLFKGFGANARLTNMIKDPVLSDKERREYPRDLYKTIIGMAENHRAPSGLTAAISNFLAEKNPDLQIHDEMTVLVPLESLLSRKAMEATIAPAGGFLIQNDIGREIEFMLRASSVCIRAGAQVLPGLRGDLTLGRETQEVTFSWLHELEEVDETESQYGALHFTPRRLSGVTSISTQLKAQAASPDIISAFIVESLSRGIGAAFDRAGIQGSGVHGEPVGLFNRSGVNTVTFSGQATLAKAVNFEKQITAANGDDDSITFIAEPATREKWRTLERFSGGGKALWEDGNLCVGRQAYVTTNVPAAGICAGDFTKMRFATWGEGSPVSVIVDPFTGKKEGKIEILLALLGDVGVLREQVFCINADSAIQ